MKSLKQPDSDTSGCLIVSRMVASGFVAWNVGRGLSWRRADKTNSSESATKFAAMPQHTAERLCLSVKRPLSYRGYALMLGGVAAG